MADNNDSQLTTNRRHRRCLCGHPNHTYSECHALNPYTRRQMWQMTKKMVRSINRQLHNNPRLRRTILRLGYEYYQPIVPPTPEPINPLHKLANMPTEILQNIIEWTYIMTVEELPSSHPLIDNKPANEYGRAKHSNSHPVPTVLNLPTRARNPYWRRRWLERHPGNWGHFFQVMFVSKKFHDIAMSIRYQEVHVDCTQDWGNGPYKYDLVCSRLCNLPMLKETKDVHLTMDLLHQQPILDLKNALSKLPKLKHLCISLRSGCAHGSSSMASDNPDLLRFFDLDIDTLTFIWVWNGEKYFYLPYDRTADPAIAPVLTKAEHLMQLARNRFMSSTYESSTWYGDTGNDGPIPKGKARLSEDWTAQKLNNLYEEEAGGFIQWNMDTFIFKLGRTGPPLWNLDKNPYNHPDQLNEEEREIQRPLRVWRKGFEPYDQDEVAQDEEAQDEEAQGDEAQGDEVQGDEAQNEAQDHADSS